jgi:ACS family sodium-dependent inorganic phosphate cotransporter
MTDKSAQNDTAKNVTEVIFDWDQPTKGLILGSFFYGYIVTQFVGGFMATKYGGNIVSLQQF